MQLEDIGAKQDEVLDRLERVELQNRLADLDRQWYLERAAYMVTDEQGDAHVPSHSDVVVSGAVALFGVFWTVPVVLLSPPMAVWGLIVIAVAIYCGITAHRKAVAYEKALQRYQQEKRRLRASVKDDVMGD